MAETNFDPFLTKECPCERQPKRTSGRDPANPYELWRASKCKKDAIPWPQQLLEQR
jgi:hypothetical protein